MNKTELGKKLAAKTGLTQQKAAEIVDTIFDGSNGLVASALAEGEKVQLHGFGTFTPKETKARKGVNPATGASIEIPARTKVSFKAGKEIAELLN
jgi:DNA-binding protein HU-beta